MSDFLERISKLSPKRLALLALELQEKLDATASKDTTREPIAVIGMACRYPGGVSDPEHYWKLLRDGTDAIREVPADRWNIDQYYHPDPDEPAHMSARSGGFLDAVDQFDASFFGVAPREALTMDPQQRLLLEVTWEALENAGVAPERLAGSPTSVFVGICNSDHFQRVLGRGAAEIDAYLASGNAHSVASGRISHFLGLQGPSVSIDTACSSSLVALHVACQSLRSGESRMALAAGVNVMCSPDTTIALSQAHMLAPDGRCKTFDATADGFSRGEGCGVLVLKRLRDATRDGDPILAVLRGTASNQDGRSGGLTVPNGVAQEAVIRAALANAGVNATDIDYVEAHGTGTSLGDPIEVRALGRALGPGRTSPLVIGSVKTNIGHLESAAGIAGVMKVILSLQHERVPPHLHFQQPSPHIGWAEHPVVVKPEGQAWPRGERRRLAGVSSFGFSGTNAHVVIEEAPAERSRRPASSIDRPLSCLPISARTTPALDELARRYRSALSAGESLANVAHTAGVGRSHFGERIAVVASDEAEARAALDAYESKAPHPGLFHGTSTPGNPPEIVFLFTGQGSQYPGMSRQLYETSAVFREVIDRCDALLGADKDGQTLKTVLFGAAAADAPIHETRWTQPALFAVELGITQLWRSWGIEPAAVIGHSLGEYAAATAAGVFTLEEGLALIAERGRLMQALPPGGTMAAIFAPIDDVKAAISKSADRVAIAAINAADSVVVSGEAAAIDALLADLAKNVVKGHRLFIGLAAHSPLVEPALAPLEEAARKITMRAPRIPVAWNLTGGAPLPGGAPDATYWRRQMREPVRFADGIASLHRDGFRVFLEVGPHPTLMALAQRSLPEDVVFLGSLRRDKDDWREMMTSLARLYVHGANVDFAGFDRPYERRRVRLPTYPFQRRSWWIPPTDRVQQQAPSAPKPVQSTLLGTRIPSAVPIFESMLSPSTFGYLAEHRLHGAAVVAGPVFAEMAQAAAKNVFGPANRAIEDLVIHEPLVLPNEGRAVQTSLGEADPNGAVRFTIHSRGDDDWRLHASGRLTTASSQTASPLSIATLSETLGAATSGAAYYERLRGLGIDLGPAFRSIETARRKDQEVLATIALPSSASNDPVTWAHPVLLDGALQAVGLAVPEVNDSTDVYLFTEVGALTLSGPLPSRILCHAQLRGGAPGARQPAEWRADVTIAREDGAVLGMLRDVCLRRASREALARAAGANRADDLFYRVAWEPAPLSLPAASLLADPAPGVLKEQFASLAAEQGLPVYDQLLPELDRLALDHVMATFVELGFDAAVGRSFTAEAEARRLGVVSKHGRLFARMLEMLSDGGVLQRRDPATFEVARAVGSADPNARYDALLARFGEVDGELRMLRRCGAGLARVLRGQQEALDLLFPGGSFAEARKLYVESPYARTYNAALRETLKAAVAALPAGARLRILEIGGGTGGTTTYVLPALSSTNAEYTFTDLSPLFLERAAEQFGSTYPFLKRALLDIEQDPIAQGFEAGAYDVVIAANVLHATADLRQTMRHVKKLLASGGLVLLLEGVAPEPWVDLTFGLTEGWWRFSDASLRGAYPLIDRAAWLRLLAELGFTGAAAVPDGTQSGRAVGQQALFVARAGARRKRWALVVPRMDDAVGEALARLLRERGDEVVLALAEASQEELSSVDEIVYLAGLAAEDARARALACEVPLTWLGRAARGELDGRVWLVTRGAQPADGTVSPSGMWQAPLWGIGRVFGLEQPARWGGLIDLPAAASADALARWIVQSLDADDGEDQTAWREDERLAARIVSAKAPAASSIRFSPDATYLVTGGFGGLGLIVARWMAEHGARHVALLGRRPDPTSDGVRAIEAAGAKVIALAGDVADEATMTSLFERLAREAPPLRGIMHAAADLGAAPIGELTPESITKMLRPKIDATVLLERLSRDLDFLVLFSSTTALLGASGLAHYAAANAFLDAFAHRHAGERTHVLAIDWGTWEAMRLASKDAQRGFKDAGLEPMLALQATEAMGRLLGASASERSSQAVVARIDWNVLKPLHEARRRRPLLTHMAVADAPRAEVKAAAGPTFVERLAAAPEAQRHDLLVGFVRQEVAAVLRAEAADAIPLETGFFDLGMDSLMSVELKRGLERGTALALPSTLTFNYPSVTALTTFLASRLAMGAGDLVLQSSSPQSSPLRPATASHDSDDLDGLDDLTDAELEAELIAGMERHR